MTQEYDCIHCGTGLNGNGNYYRSSEVPNEESDGEYEEVGGVLTWTGDWIDVETWECDDCAELSDEEKLTLMKANGIL